MAIPIKDQIIMLHHLKMSLKYDKNIEVSIRKVSQMMHQKHQKHLICIADYLSSGLSIPEAIQHVNAPFHPFVTQCMSLMQQRKHFDDIIDVTIQFLKQKLEKDRLKKKAIRYPIILLVMIGFVILTFIFFMFPMIKSLYTRFQVKTHFMIIKMDQWLSFFHVHIWVIIGISMFVVFSFNILLSQHKIKKKLYTVLHVQFKLFKSVHLGYYVKFFSLMQLLLLNQTPIYDVFRQLKTSFLKTNYEDDLEYLVRRIESGQSLYEGFKQSLFFNSMIAGIFKDAQSHQQLYDASKILTTYYQEALDIRHHQFYTRLEPMLITLLSIIVGMIAWLIYYPILNIYDGLI